jgi:hypothetical protein
MTTKELVTVPDKHEHYLVGYVSRTLKHYPIAIDYKDKEYFYRWLGKEPPPYAYGGWSPLVERVISVDCHGLFMWGEFELRDANDINSGLIERKEVLTGSLDLVEGLMPIVESLELTDAWWGLFGRQINIHKLDILSQICQDQTFYTLYPKVAEELEKPVLLARKLKKKTPPSTRGSIYAVELDGFIKMGFSRDVTQRLVSYRTSSLIVNLLFTEPATLKQELLYHKKHNHGSEKYSKDKVKDLHVSVKTFLAKK